jgi:hypothetical protein
MYFGASQDYFYPYCCDLVFLTLTISPLDYHDFL